jgi:hypothetical protein
VCKMVKGNENDELGFDHKWNVWVLCFGVKRRNECDDFFLLNWERNVSRLCVNIFIFL